MCLLPARSQIGAVYIQACTRTHHASISQVSQTVLRRCMRSLPALRDKLVGAFAGFVVRIQEEHAEVIKDSLALLLG